MNSYRYPKESIILTLTLVLVFAVIAVSAVVTLFSSVLFLLIMLVMSFVMNSSHHNSLIRTAHPVTVQTAPELAALVKSCAARLQPGPFSTYVAPQNVLNAYTFGLTGEPVVVLVRGDIATDG